MYFDISQLQLLSHGHHSSKLNKNVNDWLDLLDRVSSKAH